MNILDQIVAQKRVELAQLKDTPNDSPLLETVLAARGDRRDFVGALQSPRKGRPALIAEVKKASPSAGVIRPDFNAVRIAQIYEAAGASCISVLTDERFFQGSLEYLRQIRAAVKLPLLRKDFIIDIRQIHQSVAWGADAILLIAAILPQTDLEHLYRTATEAGLAVLVEVHDEAELDRALTAGAQIIGVNNRNLHTFTVDLATTERLAARFHRNSVQPVPILVSESGIHTRSDVERLLACGVQAMLIGESLMRHHDIPAKVGELIVW